jgi:hypothetical protein
MIAAEEEDTFVHVDDLRCADLVLGLMPEGDRATALAHAATCPECEARLRAHAGAAERAAAGRPGAARGVVTPLPNAWYRRPSTAVTLAAAAALVAVSAIPLLRNASRAPAPANDLPLPGEDVRTREGLAEDPHLTAGMAAYAAHDLARADRELTAARGERGGEQMRRLYLAAVRLERGDARGSIVLLRSLNWLEIPEPWRRDGARLLVRALRATGEGAEADSIERALETLAPGTPFLP